MPAGGCNESSSRSLSHCRDFAQRDYRRPRKRVLHSWEHSVMPLRDPLSSPSRCDEGKSPPIVLTIGHSTRPLDEFIALLKAHAVTLVVDVRTIPRSRHNPQFNEDSLPDSLKKAGIGYI